MAQKVIFAKVFKDGEIKKEEKICNTEDEMMKCFDECVESFEEFCKEFGTFERYKYLSASGEALGIACAVMVENI